MTIKVLNALIQSGKRHQNSVNPYKMANTENEYFLSFLHAQYSNKSVGETSTNTTHRLG